MQRFFFHLYADLSREEFSQHVGINCSYFVPKLVGSFGPKCYIEDWYGYLLGYEVTVIYSD